MWMKKATALVLACALALAAAGCERSKAESSSAAGEPVGGESSSAVEAPVPSAEIKVIEESPSSSAPQASMEEGQDETPAEDGEGGIRMEESAVGGVDAAGYVKAVMDAQYLGSTGEYQALVGASAEEAAAVFEGSVAYAAEVLLAQYGRPGASDEVRLRIREFYRQLYPQVKYQVTGAQPGDGLYSVTVAVTPINLFSSHVDEISAYMDAAAQKGDDEFMNGLMDMVEGYPVGYGAQQTVTINVVPNNGWEISPEDLDYLDSTVVIY